MLLLNSNSVKPQHVLIENHDRLTLMASRSAHLILLSLSCLLLLCKRADSQTATILQGQQLKHDQQLVSSSGMFKLGFKSVHENNSYLGLWYYGEDDNLVWIADRNTPISGDSGMLEIDAQGNLKILHGAGKAAVLYSAQEPCKASATLEDSGNFVLHELNSDGSTKGVLWQSFDYPTDTLLPGMKLGVNSRTGFNWSLTSWRSDMSPALGSFALGLDPNDSAQLVIWWRGETYWRSGSWNQGLSDRSQHIFSSNNSYNFSYISNLNETYFNYSVSKAVTIFPRLRLNSEGELVSSRADSTVSEVSCDKNWSNGCLKQKLPECRNPDVVFMHHVGSMSSSGFKFSESNNLSRIDCQAECLSDCACVAYASKNDDGTGCEIWSMGVSFTESTTSTGRPESRRDIFILQPKDKKWWIWLIIVLGGLMVIPPICSICYLVWKRCIRKGDGKVNQRTLLNELGDSALPSTSNNEVECHRKNRDDQLQVFSFESIAAATNYFSTANKLGEGGFGPVYKGRILDGQEIAIKRLSSSSGQGLLEFRNEALLISKLQHTNLVRLLGFCIEGGEKILIYEYMPNKSLDFFLFDSDKKYLLNWKKRFNVIEGIAQGLIYLHKYSRLRVIHRDLKASNILLDSEMNPKISDFGMARIFGLNESEANTRRVVGTYGYMSPEYAFHGIVSTKTDVFSFGVLLLEIVSGKKNNCCYHSDHPLNLIGIAWQLWSEGRGLELMDPILDELCRHNQVLRCIHVGLLCVQDRAADRPMMPDVVSMLSNETMMLPAPKQPAFYIDSIDEDPHFTPQKMSGKYSVNYVSFSIMEAR